MMRPGDDIPRLIEACRAGDQAAWTALVEHYSALVYSIPRRNGLGDADCADVFQNVFTTLVEQLENVRDPRAMTRWLIVTTQRLTWKHVESSRGTASTSVAGGEAPGDGPAAPEVSIDRWERQQLVREALQQLGPPCDQLLRTLFMEGRSPSYEEISQRLEIPVGSIGPRRARCLERLLEILEGLGLVR